MMWQLLRKSVLLKPLSTIRRTTEHPHRYFILKIIEFLGHLPYHTHAMTLGEKMATSRQFLGLGQKDLAYRLGIDASTLNLCSGE